jgi:26S proteasome regulatory subunit N10
MEATIVCIDNSEWTRSGDYAPTRFQAQADAVNLLAGAKTQANPENTVGVLTMAGKTPRVLVTPTPDLGKVLNCMTDINIDGEANIATAVQIAQLALKHRQNKNQRQRIVIFAGSPVREDKVRCADARQHWRDVHMHMQSSRRKIKLQQPAAPSCRTRGFIGKG